MYTYVRKYFMPILLVSMLSFMNGIIVHATSPDTFSAIVSTHLNLQQSVSVSIRDFQTGEVIYAHKGDVARSPASNLKLLVGAAALETLGPDYRFYTKLYYDGEIKNGTLHGNLHLVGGGDPTLLYKDLEYFAWMVKRLGITRITGIIYADVTRFSGDTLSPGAVPAEQHEHFAARVSPLTLSPNSAFKSGTIIVNVEPGVVGARPKVSGNPTLGGMEIVNEARTVKRGARNTVSVTRAHHSNKIIVRGNLPIGGSVSRELTMLSPSHSTTFALAQSLRERGITFNERYVVATKPVPASARLIAQKQSAPLSEIYRHFMKKSSNPMGDTFVKTMGYEVYGVGDFEHGIKVLNDYGTSIGLSMDAWTIVDGSGLAKTNKVPTNGLTLLLKNIQMKPYYQTFYNGLVIGGHADAFMAGALKDRFKELNVRGRVIGKTGYITGVNALTGITYGTYNGRKYIFSVLTQDYPSATSSIDAVVKGIILLK